MLSPAMQKIELEEQKAKKAGKKKEEKENVNPQQYFDVQLSETILFPEGGGQPYDMGTLDGSVKVVNVFREAEDGSITHKTTQAVEIGKEVEVVVDWSRRFDHMQQHTAQHLISAVFRNSLNHKTLSWYLAAAPAECHIEMDADSVSQDQLQHMEEEINTAIRTSLPIRVHVFDNEESAKDHKDYQAALAAGKAKPLPAGLKGQARVVETSSIEFNTCCGTHLEQTSQLQLITLTRADKVKGHSRVFFLAGNRALSALSRLTKMQQQFSKTLSATPDDFIDIVEKMQKDARVSNKQIKTLVGEVAALKAAEIVKGPSKAACLHRGDAADSQFISAVAEAVQKLSPNHLVLLTASNEDNASKEVDGFFLLVGPEMAVAKYGGDVAKALEGRGGGRKGLYQGKATRIDKRAEAFAVIKDFE